MDEELFEALCGGDIFRVKDVLERGADVNARNNDGLTPLHLVAAYGYADVAELLIRRGAYINARVKE
ncbi:ankyrin repeat domain-containing protein, partial [Candidatus Methanodesulfokora washburnensis]